MEITCVSHLLAGGVREQPLVRCLFEMLDRGESLSPIFLAPPASSSCAFASSSFDPQKALLDAMSFLDTELNANYGRDLENSQILRVFNTAADHAHGVVSVLEPPG